MTPNFNHLKSYRALNDYISGMAQPKLNQKSLNSIIVPFPSLTEQQKIVKTLDEAFTKIEKAKANIEKNIENAKELFQSKLNDVFSQRGEGWEEKTLGNLVNFKNGLNFSKSSKGELINIVGVGNFKSNFYVPVTKLSKVSIDGNLKELYELIDGDILVVRSNGNPKLIGRCILAKNIKTKTSHSGFTIRMRPISEIVYPPLLCYFLKSTKAKNHLINGGTGVSIKSLNQKTLSSLKFSIPLSVDTQKNLFKSLDNFSNLLTNLISSYQSKLKNLEELKKSLLEKAFSGELTNN